MSSLTSVRVYAVILAILCETIRAAQVWPSAVTPLLWLLELHWTITTPLIIATLVPTVSIAAICTVVAGIYAVITGILTLLAVIVTLRCNIACISTFVPDVTRVAILSLAALCSLALASEWLQVEYTKQPNMQHILILLGFVPSAVLLFSTWRVLVFPAFVFDPVLLWVTLLDRRQAYALAFGAVVLLVVFDGLHLFLFSDTEYFLNILILRTILDVGRLYMRIKTI